MVRNSDCKFRQCIKPPGKADLSNEKNDNYWDENLEIYETDYAFDAKLIAKNLTFGVNYQNRRSSTTTYNPSENTVHKGFGTLWNLQLINSYVKHQKDSRTKQPEYNIV